MAKERYEYCPACEIRVAVEARLEVPAYKPSYGEHKESPAAFWSRLEGAGQLSKGLALYDQLVAERAKWKHTRCETKKEFAERVEKEGRQAEAERLRAEFLAQGLPQREVQEKLVSQLQPLDGGNSRAWPTPNPWNEGRFCRKKADQDRLLALANGGMRTRPEDEAQRRVRWGKHRLEERRALVDARQRSQAQVVAPAVRSLPPPGDAPTPHNLSQSDFRQKVADERQKWLEINRNLEQVERKVNEFTLRQRGGR